MKKNSFVLSSILFSILIHLLFLTSAYYYSVPSVSANAAQAQKMFRVTPPKPIAMPQPEIEQKAKEEIKFQKPTEDLKNLVKQSVVKQTLVDSDVKILPEDPQNQEIKEGTVENIPQAVSDVKKEKASIQKRETQRQSLQVDRAILRDSAASSIAEENLLHIPIEFADSMHAFTPGTLSSEGISEDSDSSAQIDWQRYATNSPHFKPTSGYEKLDAFLNTQLKIYEEPSDSSLYYELSIYPNAQSEGLPILKKEVLFLIDASLSIKDYRLHAFKEGLKDALGLLNPGDLFNIYVFQDKIIPFSQRSLPANPITLKQVGYFLNRLESEDQTDIYHAFLETLEKQETLHPSYIILMSDGRANTGVDSTAKLIAKITEKNNGRRPIFSFSGGARVNRFLLDFLAYPNRGWAEYASKNTDIQWRFKDFNQKITNPVLTEVKYQFSGLSEREVYPKRLPDFYRDAVFKLYGRFEKGQDLFSLRITGKNAQQDNEFIYSNHLLKAEMGSAEIARAWAFNKVYDLISQMTLNGATEPMKNEVRHLLAKFDLKIPYDFEEIIS